VYEEEFPFVSVFHSMKINSKDYLRYLYALLAVPLVILLRYALMPLIGPGIPYITLFPVSIAVALLAGMGPAILTGFLGSIAIDYLFIEPLYAIEFDLPSISRIAVVILTSAFVGYVGEVLRAARAKAEQQALALRDSQADLNRAQTVAHTGSWRLNVQLNELTWSDESYHIFGVPSGISLTYESFLSCVHPDDREYVDKKLKAALSGEKYDIEHRIIVNGKIKWLRERAELEFDKQGTLLGGFGTATDITARKKAQEALQASETRYRRLFEVARDGILILDADSGQIVDVNPFVKDMLGYSHEEFLGKKLWEIGLFKNIVASKESFLELQTKGFVRYENLPLETKDGRHISVEFVSNVYLVDRKKVIQCNIRDITERVKAEEALRKAHDELELRVKERTSDLDETVAELEDQVQQRIAAEEALRSASLYTRGLLEASLDPMVTINQDGKITDVNRATELATGVARDEIIGSDFSDFFTEPQKANNGYRKVISEGFMRDYPLTIRHVSGSTTDVLYNATVYKDEAGQVQGVFAAARDVTARKAAEERQGFTNSLLELFAAKSSRKEYLDSTVEVVRNWSGCEFAGIRIKDADGNIPYESYVGFDKDFLALENALHIGSDKCICMRAIQQDFQRQEREFISAGGSFCCNDSPAFLKGLSQQDRKEYRGNCIKRGFQSIAVIPIRYRNEVFGAIHIADYKKGMVHLQNIYFIETTISPLIGEAIHRFNAESELEKYRLHLEDLVKLRTDELTRSNRDLQQFAYVASHDLQEPLRIIAGYTQLLQHRYKDKLDEDANQFIAFTVESTVRMQNLINDLLSYSRLETKGRDFEPVDCRAVLDEVIRTLQMVIEESGAVITYGKLPTIPADHTQLFQLFQNLIGNAIKFRSEKTPRIQIAAEPKDERWLFSIKDNGIGIAPKYSERIFVIFQRLHTREKYPGTGIGLAICKKIVERHNGRIWVESQQDKGATFYFVI
jgi:PAS domain S-box-containing protein